MKTIIVSHDDMVLLDYAIRNKGLDKDGCVRDFVKKICEQNTETCIAIIGRYCWDKNSLANLSNYSQDAIVQFCLTQTFLWLDFIKSYLKWEHAYQKEVSLPDGIVEVLESCKNDNNLKRESELYNAQMSEKYDKGDYSVCAVVSSQLIQAISEIPKTKDNILTSSNKEILMFAIRRRGLSSNEKFCDFIKMVCRENPTLCISVLQKNKYGHYLGTLPNLDDALIDFVLTQQGLYEEITLAYIASLKSGDSLPEDFVNIILSLLKDEELVMQYKRSRTEAYPGILPKRFSVELPKGIELEIKPGETVGYIPHIPQGPIFCYQPKVILRTPDNRCCFVAEPGHGTKNTSAFVMKESQEYPIKLLALANSNDEFNFFSTRVIREVDEIFEYIVSNPIEVPADALEARNEWYRKLKAGKWKNEEYKEFGETIKNVIDINLIDNSQHSGNTTAEAGSLTVVVIMDRKVLYINWGDNQIYNYANNKLEPVSTSDPCGVISLDEIGQLIVTTREFTEQMKTIMYDRFGDKSIITEMPVVASELANAAVGATYEKSLLTRRLERKTKNPSYGIMTVRGEAQL